MKEEFECHSAKRILVIGDAGRGKTTFANHIARACERPVLSLDDVFWKRKYTIVEDESLALGRVRQMFAKDAWIVEGTSRLLAQEGFDRAEVIFYFKHRSLLWQLMHLIWRYVRKHDSKFSELCALLVHTVYKRYQIGYERGQKSWQELLGPYESKVTAVESFDQVRKLMGKQ
ncbi:hypothetical protein KJ673_02865 [Patescibacteria group bacterium]|nr:hypothetical protein [Patescibacteria group bacterium]MCG2687305.1 hypothetical protein [Candidatus Parcubacteria bacterium]